MRSMTGYGRGTAVFRGRQIAVELSAVNRKQADVVLSLPKALAELEPRVREEINVQVSRGRLTVAVTLVSRGGLGVGIDLAAARAYRDELAALRKALKLGGKITLDHVLRGPGVLAGENAETAGEAAWPALRRALRTALRQFIGMRRREGRALAVDLRQRTQTVQKQARALARLAPKVVAHHRRGLLERAATAGVEIGGSDERLMKELVFFSDRSDISEEVTRLGSHLAQFFGELKKDEPVGRTLDFLLQEMFREVNTVGNKANFLAISQVVVTMKTELEKLREQVQNIE